jgi:hypothetical protein
MRAPSAHISVDVAIGQSDVVSCIVLSTVRRNAGIVFCGTYRVTDAGSEVSEASCGFHWSEIGAESGHAFEGIEAGLVVVEIITNVGQP